MYKYIPGFENLELALSDIEKYAEELKPWIIVRS